MLLPGYIIPHPHPHSAFEVQVPQGSVQSPHGSTTHPPHGLPPPPLQTTSPTRKIACSYIYIKGPDFLELGLCCSLLLAKAHFHARLF